MAEITPQRIGELMRGVFKILMDQPEGLHSNEVMKRLEDLVPPTDFENTHYEKNPQFRRYEKIVRFHSIAVVKAGWLVKDKGQWTLTDAGREAYEKITNPAQFTREARRLYKQWKADQSPDPEGTGDEAEGETTTALEEAEEAAWSGIQEHLSEMNPYDFQKLVSGLIQGMGYHVDHEAPPGPDGGIDVVAHTDPLGIHGPRIKVQVKRRADRLSVHEVRSFMAVLGDGDVGVFISTGGFTKDAETEARKQEKRRVMLLDLKRFFDLWVTHYNDIPDAPQRLLPLRPVYYLAPPS